MVLKLKINQIKFGHKVVLKLGFLFVFEKLIITKGNHYWMNTDNVILLCENTSVGLVLSTIL